MIKNKICVYLCCLGCFGPLYSQDEVQTQADFGFQIFDNFIPRVVPNAYESLKTVELGTKLLPSQKYRVSFWVRARKAPQWSSYSYDFWVFPSNHMESITRADRNLSKPMDIFANVKVSPLQNSEQEHISFIVKPDTIYSQLTIALEKRNEVPVSLKSYVDISGIFVEPLGAQDDNSLARKLVKSEAEFTVTEGLATISVYDHRKIDNDLVTIYLNDSILVRNLVLKRRKKKFNIQLRPGENTIRLHADNLGEISPNTAAIQIKSGKQKIEQILSSDLNQSEYFIVIFDQE